MDTHARACMRAHTHTQAPDSLVLVAGATGGVGQLVCAKLLERGHRVTAVARPRSKDALQGYGPDLEVRGWQGGQEGRGGQISQWC